MTDIPESDYVADTYAVVAPDGSVTFDFDGRISAQGIDIDAHIITDPQPLPHSVIQWVREDNGDIVARIWGTQAVAAGRGLLTLQSVGDDDPATENARIVLDSFPGSVHDISAAILDPSGGGSVTILRSGQVSSFVQIDTAEMGVRNWQRGIYEVNYDPASIAANGVGVENIPLPAGSLAVGEYAYCVGINTLPNGLVLQRSHGICLAADTCRIYLRNLTAAAVDSPAGIYTIITERV